MATPRHCCKWIDLWQCMWITWDVNTVLGRTLVIPECQLIGTDKLFSQLEPTERSDDAFGMFFKLALWPRVWIVGFKGSLLFTERFALLFYGVKNSDSNLPQVSKFTDMMIYLHSSVLQFCVWYWFFLCYKNAHEVGVHMIVCFREKYTLEHDIGEMDEAIRQKSVVVQVRIGLMVLFSDCSMNSLVQCGVATITPHAL